MYHCIAWSAHCDTQRSLVYVLLRMGTMADPQWNQYEIQGAIVLALWIDRLSPATLHPALSHKPEYFHTTVDETDDALNIWDYST